MKRINYFLALFTFCLTGLSSFAQINDKIYAKPEDYKGMMKRTLAVVLLEENAKVLEKLAKDKKNPERAQEYKNFIVHYNEKIKEAVPAYWKINENIEYKKESEAAALVSSKSTKYVLLAYAELKDTYGEPIDRATSTVPVLIYHRTDKDLRQPDYKIYLPSSRIRENDLYLPCDFKFALMQMQDNLNYNMKNNVALNFEDYAKKMMESNCTKLNGYKLLVEKDFLYKGVTEADATANYGKNLKLVTADELNESYINSTEGEAVLFSIPFGLSGLALVYIKVIANSATGEIYYIFMPKMGTTFVYQILKGDFKKFTECK